jgi:hypothetical protein
VHSDVQLGRVERHEWLIASRETERSAPKRVAIFKIDPATWRHSRSFWTKFKERWAYFLLARVDPYVAQRQLRRL